MALPKIQYPTFTIEVPSTKKKQTFRPFLVKEEKILLMAKASGLESDVFKAIKQIVNNCCIDPSFDVDNLTLFDMEFLFIRIRAASVDNVVSVTYKDYEDQKEYPFDVDLNKVTVTFPEGISNTIKVNKDLTVVMRYPSASIYDDQDFLSSGEEAFFKLIVHCIDKIYDGDQVYDAKVQTKEEIEEFIENLDVKSFDAIKDFIVQQPTMIYTIEYKNSLGNDRKIEMRTLSDFFTLR